ncbi:hypothetical protein [Arthrobacter sp. StoSoilA2]|uniref:hypothetical protein n=1 Tax=Arthrobacter sp. StoSoilA2 TaxID=2830990 RepID=UPI0021E117F0|nr:hypothetical protein [Arthrobacter sp. StoSoilA2]
MKGEVTDEPFGGQGSDQGAGAGGGDHVDCSGRGTGLFEDLCQEQHGQRGLLGRLDDDGAAGRDGEGDLADADGFAGEDHLSAAAGGFCVRSLDPGAFLGVPLQVAGRVVDLAAGFSQRLAHLRGHDRGEFLFGLQQQFVCGEEDVGAGTGGEGCESVLRGVGGIHCGRPSSGRASGISAMISPAAGLCTWMRGRSGSSSQRPLMNKSVFSPTGACAVVAMVILQSSGWSGGRGVLQGAGYCGRVRAA